MKHLWLVLIFIFVCAQADAQIFRYRLSGNSTFFMKQPGEPEVMSPLAEGLSHQGSSDFKSGLAMGAELEIMAPVTTDFEVGIELDYSQLSGHTETAPLYNFFLSKYNPLPDTYKYPDEALIYTTNLYNILGTTRFYFLPFNGNFNAFFKAFGGVSFVGTDFTFYDPFYRVEYNVGVLYSQGTRSNEDPKDLVFNGGAGLGTVFRLSDKWDLCIEGTASMIHSDIVNGVPDFDYVENPETPGGTLQRADKWSLVTQMSVGLIYSAIPDRRLNKGNYTRSRRSSKKLFWKRKNWSPFSKKRR